MEQTCYGKKPYKHILFHPDFTVGTGITPVRLSFLTVRRLLLPVWNFTKPQRYCYYELIIYFIICKSEHP